MQWDYSDRAKFEVVAFGCHKRASDRLREFFDRHGVVTFQFVEYFFLHPVTRNQPLGQAKTTLCFFPFLRRLLRESQFIPTVAERGRASLTPVTEELLERFERSEETGQPRRWVIPISASEVGVKVLTNWHRRSSTDDPFPCIARYATQDEWRRYEESLKNKGLAGVELEQLQLEFDILMRAWMYCAPASPCLLLGYPIASEDVYYGHFIVQRPDKPLSDDAERELDQLLRELVERYYQPVLALCHNGFLERELGDLLSPRSNRGPIEDHLIKDHISKAQGVWGENCRDSVERGLGHLWLERHRLFEKDSERSLEHARDRLAKTLLFARYDIGSPGMVEQIREIMEKGSRLTQPARPDASLPCALIFGEAGAGKETMARLIPLFTPFFTHESTPSDELGYFGAELRVVNLAALKPNALVGPLLLGTELETPATGAAGSVTGILARNITARGTAAGGDSEQGGGTETVPAVFILDELNSMDVDLQGILLRVLEQGEVLPLFGAEPHDVRHLIIGVVNEDPEALTHEHEARSLQRTKDLLGSLVGVFLSEGLNRGRRLRPDLYYRFSRTLYVKLPPLRDRREDIPILFYRPCLEAVEAELRSRRAGGETTGVVSQQRGAQEEEDSVGVLVDLEAYELLMRPELEWPGNIRQVQKVARDVAVEACRWNPTGPIVRVKRRMVEKVLQKRFPAFTRPDVSSSDA